MTRSKGEIPFSDNVWLKRYHDQKNWSDIRESQAMKDTKDHFCPEDVDRMIRNAKIGGMVLNTKYFDLMYIQDSMYQDELPINENFKDYIYNQ